MIREKNTKSWQEPAIVNTVLVSKGPWSRDQATESELALERSILPSQWLMPRMSFQALLLYQGPNSRASPKRCLSAQYPPGRLGQLGFDQSSPETFPKGSVTEPCHLLKQWTHTHGQSLHSQIPTNPCSLTSRRPRHPMLAMGLG